MSEEKPQRISINITDENWEELKTLLKQRGLFMNSFYTELTKFGIEYLKQEETLAKKLEKYLSKA